MLQRNNKKKVQNHASERMPKNTKKDTEPPKIPITDAVVLAALTVFAYVFHYFFEYGYLSYFGVPTAFISFNFTEMIPAISFLVAAYMLFVFVLWPYMRNLLAVLPGFIKTILLFFPWFFIFVFWGFPWEIVLLAAFSILLILGFNKLKNDRARKISGRAVEPDPKVIGSGQEKKGFVELIPATGSWSNKILPNGNSFLLLYFLFFALASSMALGRMAAVTRSTFPISDTSPGCAVVYTTTERYICKPFNHNNEFENTYKIFYFQESQNIEFRNEEIGRLRPMPNLAPKLLPTLAPSSYIQTFPLAFQSIPQMPGDFDHFVNKQIFSLHPVAF